MELDTDTDDAATVSAAAAAAPAASSNHVVDCSLVATTVNAANDTIIIANYGTDIIDTSSTDPNGVC